MRRKAAHGLSIEECDKLATQRKLLSRAVLPNQDGYKFYGHAADGWRYDCYIKQDANGLHKIAGEAGYNEIIGWSVKSASINS